MQVIRCACAIAWIYFGFLLGLLELLSRYISGKMLTEEGLEEFVISKRLSRILPPATFEAIVSHFRSNTHDLFPASVFVSLHDGDCGRHSFAVMVESLCNYIGLREVSRVHVYFRDGDYDVACVVRLSDGFYYYIGSMLVSILSSHDTVNIGKIAARKLRKRLDFVIRFEYYRLIDCKFNER